MYRALVKTNGDEVEAFIAGPQTMHWEVAAWVGGQHCEQHRFPAGAAAIRWAYLRGATRMTVVGIPPRMVTATHP